MNYPNSHSPSWLRQPFISRAGSKKFSFLGNALVFMLPIFGLLKIELVGELFVHEAILIVLFPFLFLKRGKLLTQITVKTILLFGLMWFGSQAVTDIIRVTPPMDYLRGWAKISFFLISFAALVMLLTTPLRVFLWIAASTVPLFYRPFQLFGDDLDPLVLWKFGVGPALLLAACLPSFWKLFKNPSNLAPVRRIALLHIIFGCGSFFLNARSFAGLSILTGVLLLLFSRYRGVQLKTPQLVAGLVATVAISFGLLSVYSAGASSGYFGAEAKYKYEMQNSHGGGGPLSVLLGGRSESLVSTVAIVDSPLIGHGSWAKDIKYTWMLIDLTQRSSADEYARAYRQSGLIPSHSYLFGAWVDAGFLGGLFWMVILLLCLLRVIPSAFDSFSPLAVYAVMALPLFLWNVLFSPFGANVRVEVAGILAIFTVVVALRSNKLSNLAASHK